MPRPPGLVVVLQLEDGNWRWDETMTGFPMERLYEELCHRYHLPGQFVIPEMAARCAGPGWFCPLASAEPG